MVAGFYMRGRGLLRDPEVLPHNYFGVGFRAQVCAMYAQGPFGKPLIGFHVFRAGPTYEKCGE